MAEPPSGPPSFDPKTWGPKAAESPARPPDDISFDMKTWVRPGRPPAARRRSVAAPLLVVGGLVAAGIAGVLGLRLWAPPLLVSHLAPPSRTAVHSPLRAGSPGPGLASPAPASATPAAAASAAPASAPPPAAQPSPALAADEGRRQTLTVTGRADLAAALTAAGVGPREAQSAGALALARLPSREGQVRLVMNLTPAHPFNRLLRLDARFDDGVGVVVTATPSGRFAAVTTAAHLDTQVEVRRGRLDDNSFYSSAVAAGVTDELITPFAQAFVYDFDFQRDLHPGDVFEVVFERRVNAMGEGVGAERLLFASLETSTISRAFYRFTPPGQSEGWFDSNGRGIVRSLMRTPIEGARVSSGYGMRFHPVLGYMRMHRGIDFAAPIGTRIFAAGNGVVLWAGMRGPNGNLVIIQHANNIQTFYLHMSAYGPGIVTGAHVVQGQQVGAVGTTGRSTGPHLHFEVHVNGEAVNPATITGEQQQALTGDAMRAFLAERNRIDALRNAPHN